MLVLALALILAGWLFLYSGIRNVHPMDEIKGAFGR